MYSVTYKNILKSDKTLTDFQKWIESSWSIQQKWSAVSYQIWNGRQTGREVLFCRYLVSNIDRWNRGALSTEANRVMKSLGKVVDIDRISIQIRKIESDNA